MPRRSPNDCLRMLPNKPSAKRGDSRFQVERSKTKRFRFFSRETEWLALISLEETPTYQESLRTALGRRARWARHRQIVC